MLRTYLQTMLASISDENNTQIDKLFFLLKKTISNKGSIFLCGNGGSAANSIHIANDFIYHNNNLKNKKMFKVESLASNSAVITCIANDINYDDIFSNQLMTKAKKNDLLIILSGSGNSKNILNAIKISKLIGMNNFGVLGFDGGKAKKILNNYVHFNISDMQIVEDLQTVIFHNLIKKIN